MTSVPVSLSDFFTIMAALSASFYRLALYRDDIISTAAPDFRLGLCAAASLTAGPPRWPGG